MAREAQFHLAFPVDDLERARAFYGGVMGCPEGRASDVYVDFDLFGHQIVAHLTSGPRLPRTSVFDGHEVPVPHFGLNMRRSDWQELAVLFKAHDVTFLEQPHQRLEGQLGRHLTMFILDPFGNALEFKSFDDVNSVFAVEPASALSRDPAVRAES
jgi:extradiol dioxygenase family protein